MIVKTVFCLNPSVCMAWIYDAEGYLVKIVLQIRNAGTSALLGIKNTTSRHKSL